MVLALVAATSFAILLLFFSPSCLRLCVTSFSAKGVGADASSLYFVRHQPRHQPVQWLLHVHEDVSQHARTIIFSIVGHLVRLPVFHHVLPPQPVAPAHGQSLLQDILYQDIKTYWME